MCQDCCRCPEGLTPLLDRRVIVATKYGEITGFLRAIGETFLEVAETDPRLELTVIPCAHICHIRPALLPS